jgi:hypothetical protein
MQEAKETAHTLYEEKQKIIRSAKKLTSDDSKKIDEINQKQSFLIDFLNWPSISRNRKNRPLDVLRTPQTKEPDHFVSCRPNPPPQSDRQIACNDPAGLHR